MNLNVNTETKLLEIFVILRWGRVIREDIQIISHKRKDG